MTDTRADTAALWDDNPAKLDLLGFDAIVAPIIDAALSSDLDPLTIGVHAPWGGGKSTLLGLIAAEVGSNEWVHVIWTNPHGRNDRDLVVRL